MSFILFDCTSHVNVSNDFGHGILPIVATPAPVAKTEPDHVILNNLIAGGMASRRPRTDGYGLTSLEWMVLNRHVNAARHKAESNHFGSDDEMARKVGDAIREASKVALLEITRARPVLEPIVAVTPAKPSSSKGSYGRRGVFTPSQEDEAWYAGMLAWEDTAAAESRRTIREIMDQTSWIDRTCEELARD